MKDRLHDRLGLIIAKSHTTRKRGEMPAGKDDIGGRMGISTYPGSGQMGTFSTHIIAQEKDLCFWKRTRKLDEYEYE